MYNIADFARKKGDRDKKKRKKKTFRGVIRRVLGVEINKDGTKMLSPREEMIKQAIPYGALGTLVGTGVLAGGTYLDYKKKRKEGLLKINDKRFETFNTVKYGKMDRKYEYLTANRAKKFVLNKAPLAMLAGAAGVGAIGSGLGYLNYLGKKKVIKNYRLDKEDSKKVNLNRKINDLKENRKYI